MAPKEKPPFVPKGEYAPGAEVIWEEGGEVHVGQVWAPAPAEGGHPAVWVVPFEPVAGEYAVRIVRGRKGGGRIGRSLWNQGQHIAEGECVAVQRVYPGGEFRAHQPAEYGVAA